MKTPEIKPAGQFCLRYGVKAILYGQAGTNKTPSVITAPNPFLMAIEPGLRSMKGSTVPAAMCDTTEKIKDFFAWWHGSSETKKYDTLFIDSGSHWAETILAHKLKSIKHGQKAYGEMADDVMFELDKLYLMPQKHVVVVCKEAQIKRGTQAIMQNGAIVVEDTFQSAPYFPGQVLSIKAPHQYDCIWQAIWFDVQGQKHSAVRTAGSDSVYARTRGGMEAGMQEIEPLNFTQLFDKLMK